MMLRPPAALMVNVPSVSLSKLISRVPETRDASNSLAPVIPVSSSTVKRPSIFCTVSSSISARIRAIPIPLSAPKVEPTAWRHSSVSRNDTPF